MSFGVYLLFLTTSNGLTVIYFEDKLLWCPSIWLYLLIFAFCVEEKRKNSISKIYAKMVIFYESHVEQI